MLNAVLALNELDTKVFESPIPGEAPRVYDSHVTVPDAHLLFNGEFKRVGSNDLKIVGEDGQSFFIQDYFASETRAHLMSPEGATLSASVVEALAGPLAPGQHAQAGGQAASTQPVIGRVDALSGSATVVRNGVTVSLNVGDTVRKGDVVQTSGGSSVAIVFTDGSTFSLNANARMVLDEFVYAAGGTGNTALISLVQGTFSFVAGQVAKNGDMRVETPVATMGIRGTAVLVEISANDGQTRFSVMVEPDGTTGSFNLYNKTTGALIGTVSNSQIGWVVTPAGPLQVVAQQVQKTPAELAQELGIVQQIFTIFDNNQQNPFVPTQDRGDNPNNANPQTAQGGGGSGTPPPNTTTTNNPLADLINAISGNPSTPPSSATVQLPTDPLPGANTGSPPPVVTVTVSPNQAPVAVDDPNGTQDGGNVITPTDPEAPGTDLDPEGGDLRVVNIQRIVDGELQGEPETVGPEGALIVGALGTLTIDEDGEYAFEPNDAFRALAHGVEAIDTFQYTITDPFGLTASAILTINLTGVNDAPVANDVTLEVNVLGNGGFESNPDFLGWTLEEEPDELSDWGLSDLYSSSVYIDRSGNIFTGDNAVAVLSFSGEILDPGYPEAEPGAAHGPSVTSNVFTGYAGDTIRLVYQLSSGSSTGSSDTGKVTARIIDVSTNPPQIVQEITDTAALASSTGIRTFNVQLVDSGQFQIEFIVGSIDDTKGYVVGARLDIGFAGIIQNGVSEDFPYTFSAENLLANATDAEGDTLTLNSVATSTNGAFVYINSDGTVTYDPTSAAAIQALAAGETITDTFTFTIRDEHDAISNQATATITVRGANDAPAALSDSAFVLSGDTVEINVLANDSDVDDNSLTIIGVGVAEHGIVSITEDGTITYTPNEGFSGTDSFTYTIADPHQASATGHVSVVVGSANHQQVAGDVFLQGNYMEIGVSSSGSLGTANPAPEGYHPQGFSGISYVVDIDGWDTGENPTAGDFTLPGSPVDTIVIGHDNRSFANDERSISSQISTSTLDTSANGRLQATTSGSTSSGLSFTQIVDLDPGATYYKTTIILTNTTDAIMDDVRFMRSFDPDQDVARYNTYYTYNDVLANPEDTSDIAIAQAYGHYSGVSVNLIAFDSDARASNFGFANYSVYTPAAFDSPVDLNGAYRDEAITLTFSAGDLAAGGSAQFVFYTSLNGDQGGNDMLVGTGGADAELNGRGGDDIIIALGGNDSITGGAGNDRFIFSPGSGHDTIVDFTAGAGTDDVIELRGFDVSFQSLIASATLEEGDTVLHLTAVDYIRLVDVDLGMLHKDDFAFV